MKMNIPNPPAPVRPVFESTRTVPDGGEGDGPGVHGGGAAHEEFKEVQEVLGLIDKIPNICNDQLAVEVAVDRFRCKLIS